MLVVHDKNNIRGSFSLSSLSNCASFILTALSLSVWQDSSWSDMSAFSGETITTNGFDVRLLSFPVRSKCTAICRNLVDNRDKRFPMPVQQARKRETGSWTIRRSFFFIVPSSRLSETEEDRLSKSLRLNSSDMPIVHAALSKSCLQCGLNKWQRNLCK